VKKPFQQGLYDELIIDNFAGGGGASLAIEQATGRPGDIAINHDPEAVAMHKANHPFTKHYCENVWDVDPREVARQVRKVGLAWFSPDCKHFSKAKGGKPVEKKIRGLAWVVVRYAATVRPRIIFLENVEEFQTWGPLLTDGKPCPDRKGFTFRRWVKELEKLGYQVEWKELVACDYGAPTSRNRLFLIARCDGQPIVWPEPTHGKGLLPYKTAADCIDWSIPCPSIFLSKEEGKKAGVKRPLVDATHRRIAKGTFRYVIDNPEPFFVPFITECANSSSQRNMSANEPLRTICAQTKGGHFALVAAFLAKHYTGVVGSALDNPLGTVTSIDHHSLVAANMVRMMGQSGPHDLKEPIRTLVSKNKDALVTAHIVKMKGQNIGHDCRQPLQTVTSGGLHFGLVQAFLLKYYGTDQDPRLTEPLHTLTTKERFGLVTVQGVDYPITDIGMRMLQSRELYRAQGFPDSYIIDPEYNGKPLTKTAQVRMVGNSVSPPPAKALIEANYMNNTARQHKEEPLYIEKPYREKRAFL